MDSLGWFGMEWDRMSELGEDGDCWVGPKWTDWVGWDRMDGLDWGRTDRMDGMGWGWE